MYRGEIVETGDADTVTSEPSEAYTAKLLLAAPVADPVEQAERRRHYRALADEAVPESTGAASIPPRKRNDVRFGFSSYSFYQKLRTGAMSLLDVVDWVAASEGEHLEIATVSLSKDMTNDTSTLVSDHEFAAALGSKARSAGVPLSNLVIPANFLTDTKEDYEREMKRVKDHILVADALDIRLFRTMSSPGHTATPTSSITRGLCRSLSTPAAKSPGSQPITASRPAWRTTGIW